MLKKYIDKYEIEEKKLLDFLNSFQGYNFQQIDLFFYKTIH